MKEIEEIRKIEEAAIKEVEKATENADYKLRSERIKSKELIEAEIAKVKKEINEKLKIAEEEARREAEEMVRKAEEEAKKLKVSAEKNLDKAISLIMKEIFE